MAKRQQSMMKATEFVRVYHYLTGEAEHPMAGMDVAEDLVENEL